MGEDRRQSRDTDGLPRICVAGIDPETFEHVRPTTPPVDPITRILLREQGGPFGWRRCRHWHGRGPPQPSRDRGPPVRDRRGTSRRGHGGRGFSRAAGQGGRTQISPAPSVRHWNALAGSTPSGSAVASARSRCSVLANSWSWRWSDRFGRLQLRLNDVNPPTYLPVTDVRFYEADQETIKTDVVDDVSRRLKSGVDAFLMLGLARAYQSLQRRPRASLAPAQRALLG